MPLLFKDFYDQMIEQKKAYETSPVTMERIDTLWRLSIAPFWKDIDPANINQQLVVKYMNWHKEHRPGIQIINAFKYVGNVFNVMVEAGAMELSRKPDLELPKDEQKHHAKQKGRYITDEEFQRILSVTSGWFKLYFLIIFSSGFRKMELGKMQVSRLSKIENRYVATLGTEDTKTGRARVVPFSDALTELVEEQLKAGSPYLFPSVDKSKHVRPHEIDSKWVKAKRLAKIEGKCRLHDTRHSCASNLAKDGINPIVVVTNLGMSLAMFQKTYLKLTPQDLFIASDSAKKRMGKI